MRITMVISKKNTLGLKVTSALCLLVLLGLNALMFSLSVARADTADDLAKALGNQRYYVANDVKTNSSNTAKDFRDKNPNLEQGVSKIVSDLKGKRDVAIAVLSNEIIPAQFTGTGATSRYADFLYGFLDKPKPEILILFNAQSGDLSMRSAKLTDAETQDIVAKNRSTFTTSGAVKGLSDIANQAADKIGSNESGSLLTTLIIIAVIALIVASVAFFAISSTKTRWKERLANVERLADQVSTQVVKISDDVAFLPDDSRAQADAEFGAATQNFSEANTRLSELQKVSPITLLLKGPDYERKLDLTGAQFEQARQALSRVEQEVRRSLPS